MYAPGHTASEKALTGAGASPGMLGGSWVVISGVMSPLIWVITIVTLLITPLITAHEPPSGPRKKSRRWKRLCLPWLRCRLSGASPCDGAVLLDAIRA